MCIINKKTKIISRIKYGIPTYNIQCLLYDLKCYNLRNKFVSYAIHIIIFVRWNGGILNN